MAPWPFTMIISPWADLELGSNFKGACLVQLPKGSSGGQKPLGQFLPWMKWNLDDYLFDIHLLKMKSRCLGEGFYSTCMFIHGHPVRDDISRPCFVGWFALVFTFQPSSTVNFGRCIFTIVKTKVWLSRVIQMSWFYQVYLSRGLWKFVNPHPPKKKQLPNPELKKKKQNMFGGKPMDFVGIFLGNITPVFPSPFPAQRSACTSEVWQKPSLFERRSVLSNLSWWPDGDMWFLVPNDLKICWFMIVYIRTYISAIKIH